MRSYATMMSGSDNGLVVLPGDANGSLLITQVVDGEMPRRAPKLAAEQNPDGGWGWFTGMESNPYITSYAALGLIEARDAGFAVDTSMLDRALNFVRGDFIRPVIDTPAWQLNRQAFYLYVFARNGESVLNEMDALLAQRLEMDFWARGFLLMAYHQLDPGNAAVASLVSDLQSGAIVSATGAHWEEADMDWWNWSSDTRSTAIVMAALTRVTPDYDLLPNVVRWLMVARNGDHWETTQETAWAVMGLTDWMKASGELEGNYDYAVTLNGDLQTEGTVTPETVRDGQTLQVAVKDLGFFGDVLVILDPADADGVPGRLRRARWKVLEDEGAVLLSDGRETHRARAPVSLAQLAWMARFALGGPR